MDFVRPIEALIPGAQGRLLGALARTNGPVTLRAAAELAGVSPAQCSRLLRPLVVLGVVDRDDIPPAAHFRFVREHLMARPLLDLLAADTRFLDALGQAALKVRPRPNSVVVFGSLVRGEARADSDIDVLVVRSADVDTDDAQWRDGLAAWVANGERISGNPLSLLEVDEDEARRRLRRDGGVWTAIRNEGRVVYGLTVDELRGEARGPKRSNAKRVAR